MRHHRYHKERITSFLTNFEFNTNSMTQRYVKNKCCSLDDEKMHISCQRYQRLSAKFVDTNKNDEKDKNTQESKINSITVIR